MSDFPVVENPSKLKVVELKEELDKRGLPLGGLKKDLVARLEDAQGLTRAPEPEQPGPDPALPETKGEEEDLAKPADTLMDAAVPPKQISYSNTPVISDDVISTEVAAEHHPDQSAPVHPPPIESTSSGNGKGEATGEEGKGEEGKGVGHVMVEGGPERTEEIREAEAAVIKSPETKVQASFQPAALDSEVAKMIAEEEMKDTIPASPDVVKSASPEPKREGLSESRVQTPDLDNDEDVLDLGDEAPTGGKRRREDDMVQAPKRPKRQFRSLPDELSHLIHPPTTCLYISNLRRPLLLPALHEYIFPDPQESATHSPLLPPPKAPFSSAEYPNVWLSGIKSHAYAVFDTVEQSIDIATKIDGKVFPEETGGKLKVDFVDEDEITRLVQREEQAWSGGRQKLELKIMKVDEGEEGNGSGYRFELSGGNTSSSSSSGSRPMPGQGQGQGQGQGRNAQPPPQQGRRAPVAVPLTGINATPIGQGGSRFQGAGPGPGALGQGQGQGQGFRGGPGGPGGPGLGQRGAPPHLDRSGGGGYRGDRGDSYRPGPGGMPGPNGRGGGGGGYGGGGVGERRTKTRPELSWKEGPRAK